MIWGKVSHCLLRSIYDVKVWLSPGEEEEHEELDKYQNYKVLHLPKGK